MLVLVAKSVLGRRAATLALLWTAVWSVAAQASANAEDQAPRDPHDADPAAEQVPVSAPAEDQEVKSKEPPEQAAVSSEVAKDVVKADEPAGEKGDEEEKPLEAKGEEKPVAPTGAAPQAVKPEASPSAPQSAKKSPPSGLLAAPETELALAKTELDNLTRRLATANQLAGRLGLGPQTASAERSWRNAQNFFTHQEWDSTVRELNNYLNQTQVPQIKNYLRAQFMLGHSYEEMGYKSKGLRAYFRYLATFLTAKEQDHAELVEVLRRMIPLATSDVQGQNELRELLASVTSLELPKEVQPLVYFYAAKAAANSAETALAQSWLENAAAAPNEPILKAKALYMEALLALGRKDFDRAKDLLSEVIQTDQDGASRDLARLALARLAVHQKERDTALKYYALIGEPSTAFKAATFESIYVHLDLKQDSLARSKSLLYLARWPEGTDALQLRMLMAYLDMRAGDLASANTSIKAADSRLKDIHSYLTTKVSGANKVNQTMLTDLMTLTGGQLPLSPAVRDATKLFGRLAEVTRRLADIRGHIRNILFTIGRANVEQLRPFWVNRAEQLGTLGEDLLKVGQRLVAAETLLYQSRLSPVALQQLGASEKRRFRLLTPAAASHRQVQNWGAFAAFAELTRNLATAQDKLWNAQAQLTAARFISATGNKGVPSPRSKNLGELTTKVTQLRERLAKGVEMLRRARVEELAVASPHQSTAKFIAQYAASLHAESQILGRARDEVTTTAQTLSADDGAKAWVQWEFLMKDLFQQLAGLGQETKSGLSTLLAELDSEERAHSALEQRLKETTAILEAELGVSMSGIIDQYSRAIDARFARNQKWQGDIHWLTFNSKLDEAKKLQDQTDLEQQILRDNLLDLQQGALWSWPK